MAKIELDYIEIDGLLYPNIEVDGQELLDNLVRGGKFSAKIAHMVVNRSVVA